MNDVTHSTLDEEKKRAEINKLLAETSAIGRSYLSRPGTWIPMLVAIAGVVSAVASWQAADRKAELESLRAEEEALEKQRELLELTQQFVEKGAALDSKARELEVAERTKAVAIEAAEEIRVQLSRQEQLLDSVRNEIEKQRAVLAEMKQSPEISAVRESLENASSEIVLSQYEVVLLALNNNRRPAGTEHVLTTLKEQGFSVRWGTTSNRKLDTALPNAGAQIDMSRDVQAVVIYWNDAQGIANLVRNTIAKSANYVNTVVAEGNPSVAKKYVKPPRTAAGLPMILVYMEG